MLNIKKGYTFDDVLLVPKHSNIKSRKNVDLSVDLGKGIKLSIPIVSANMKNVTGAQMANKLEELGGLPILHRFYSTKEEYLSGYCATNYNANIGISIGVNDDGMTLLSHFYHNASVTPPKIVCIDVAHGDSKACADMTEYVAKKHPDVLLISGNVATWRGAKTLYEAGADVVKVGVGPGCLIGGTRILMSNGTYKNIEEIKPGDRVINKNGIPVNVADMFCTGVRKVLKIRHTLSHKPTYVTPDHRFWVGDLNSVSKTSLKNKRYVNVLSKQSKTIPKQSKYKWKRVGDLKQDCLLLPNSINFELNNYFEVNIYTRDGGNGKDGKSKLDAVLKPSYDLGYLFGTFLGDGHASCVSRSGSKIGATHWYFGKNERFIADKLALAIKRCVGKTPVIKNKENILDVTLYYKPLADFLYSFGKKKEKHLPSDYLIDDKNYLKGILDGLIDSDGHIEPCGRVRFTNASEYLTELFGIVNVLLTGVFPNKTMRLSSSGGLKNCNIENCNDGYVSEILTAGCKRFTKEYQVAKMLEMSETTIEVPVYDITVDCDTHSFIANNAIVHNSLCTTRVETGNGYPQLSALEEIYEYSQSGKLFKVIADGGIKSAGDMVKALCFSHCVMLGNLLAGTQEAPGDVITVDGLQYKQYAGSSTHKANHVEGVVGIVPYKGPVSLIIQKLTEGVRSGLSYQGANNLEELRNNPKFVSISGAGLIESHPHDITLKG